MVDQVLVSLGEAGIALGIGQKGLREGKGWREVILTITTAIDTCLMKWREWDSRWCEEWLPLRVRPSISSVHSLEGGWTCRAERKEASNMEQRIQGERKRQLT